MTLISNIYLFDHYLLSVDNIYTTLQLTDADTHEVVNALHWGGHAVVTPSEDLPITYASLILTRAR